MLSIWSSILSCPRWEDEDRLSTLVRLSASEAASSVISSGHAYAMKHASSSFTPAAGISEKISGLTQVARLKEIAARVETEGKKRAVLVKVVLVVVVVVVSVVVTGVDVSVSFR